MRKILAIVLVLVLSIGVLIPVSASEENNQKREYLVGFNGEINRGLVKAFGVSDEEILYQFTIIPTLLMELTPNRATALAKNPQIQYVEENAEVYPIDFVRVPWNIQRIQADTAHSYGFTGSNVKIAVVDTGIDYHPDLDPNIMGGYSIFTKEPCNDPRYDPHGHGTHVAGVILQTAPDAHLYSVKVIDTAGSGSFAGVAQGIEWSVVNGMDLINLSVSATFDSSTLKNACDFAWNAGILLVAGAGNNGNSSGGGDNIGFPAKYTSVMAVAATDTNNVRASFSSTGPALEISAPGVSIRSTVPGGGYESRNGTSYAAPHITGVAALIKSAKWDITAAQIREAINNSALYLGAYQHHGHGLVRAMDAINYAFMYF